MPEHDNIVFSLADFTNNELHNTLFKQFKFKMRNLDEPQYHALPFSMKFEQVAIIQPSDKHSLRAPSDVKISHSQNCICVSAQDKEIQFFDLGTLQLLAKFNVGSVCGLLIEENHECDASIYFGKYGNSCKCRVRDLLNCKSVEAWTGVEMVWKIRRSHRGMAIRKVRGNQKELFRYDFLDAVMDVINPENGIIIRKIVFEGLSSIFTFVFITPTRLMLSDMDTDKCYIYDELNENEWTLVKTLEKADGINFSQPIGMAIDRKGEKIFLSDFDNKRIVVFNLEGDVVACFKSDSKKLNPFGLDFDDRTGLLYVSDQQDHSIRIFK